MPRVELVVPVRRDRVEGTLSAGEEGAPAAGGAGRSPEASSIGDMATKAGAQDPKTL
jgi:hypothetical protein